MTEERQEDPVLLSLTLGMDRHFGYREYKRLFQENVLRTGEEIILFSRLPSSSYMDFRYYIVDEETVRRAAGVYKTKKLLQGINWFVLKR